MRKKIVEKHITVDELIFDKLKLIAKKEDRKYRAVVTRLINKAFEEMKDG